MKPVVLDLGCGAGMASDGYVLAGCDVIGVDIEDQPDYPYRFVQADMFDVLMDRSWLASYDIIHASPPCQLFTRARHLRDAQGGKSRTLDLLTPMIAALEAFDRPWVIENVTGARDLMPGAVQVCGSSFGLDVQRHRLFLSNKPIVGTKCNHSRFPIDPITGTRRPWGVYHVQGDRVPSGGRTALDAEHARQLFDMQRSLPWDSIKEGFPPAYTEHIGKQLKWYVPAYAKWQADLRWAERLEL